MNRNDLIEKLKKNFDIRELVCSHCYDRFGHNSWQFLSTELLSTLYVLRYVIFNLPITVNTWKDGGAFSQRGLRCNICDIPSSKKSIYLSAHCLGNAIDFDVKGYSAEQVRDIIRRNISKFDYPIRMELDTNWVHIDCYQPYGSQEFLVEFNG